jgi:hypothetical protein
MQSETQNGGAEASEARYHVESREGKFDVRSDSGRVVVTCRDRPNAEEYAALLNEAWKRGYKAGYRAGRT